MVNFFKKLFITISFIFLFCTTNVSAQTYINTDLYPNLIMPRNVRFYGWSSNTQYEVLQTSCTDSSSSNQYCYFGSSGEPFYNDNNGFSIYFDLPNSVPKGTALNLDYILCGTNTNNYYNGNITYGIGTTPSNVLTDNYNPTDVAVQSVTPIPDDDIFTFRSCRRFSISLTTPDTGTRFALRIRSTSNVDLGILALMGITSTNYGFDYSTQFDEMTEQQEITNEKLDNIDNTLNNSAIDNPDFEEFEEYIAENGVITQLITLPVRLYTQILNNINSSCTPFTLGELFGYNLTMDCIEPSDFFGVALWNTIDILGSGLFIYAISKKMIAVFHQFTNLEEGDILD